jgi:hypothetical protein
MSALSLTDVAEADGEVDLVVREANDIDDAEEDVDTGEDAVDEVLEEAVDVEDSVDVSEDSALSDERVDMVTARLAAVVGCKYMLEAGEAVTGAWTVACVSCTDAWVATASLVGVHGVYRPSLYVTGTLSAPARTLEGTPCRGTFGVALAPSITGTDCAPSVGAPWTDWAVADLEAARMARRAGALDQRMLQRSQYKLRR